MTLSGKAQLWKESEGIRDLGWLVSMYVLIGLHKAHLWVSPSLFLGTGWTSEGQFFQGQQGPEMSKHQKHAVNTSLSHHGHGQELYELARAAITK